eukprot:g2973.t1
MSSKSGNVVSLDSIIGVVFNFYCKHGRTAAGVGKARQGPGSKLKSLTLDAFIKFVNECQGWRSGGTWLDVSSITNIFAAHKRKPLGATGGHTATMGLAEFLNALPVLAAAAFPSDPPAAALERFYDEVVFAAPFGGGAGLGPSRSRARIDLAAGTVPRARLQGKPWSGYVARSLEKADRQAHEAKYRQQRRQQQGVAPSAAIAATKSLAGEDQRGAQAQVRALMGGASHAHTSKLKVQRRVMARRPRTASNADSNRGATATPAATTGLQQSKVDASNGGGPRRVATATATPPKTSLLAAAMAAQGAQETHSAKPAQETKVVHTAIDAEVQKMPATVRGIQQPPGATLKTAVKPHGVDDSEELHPEWLQASDEQDGKVYYYHRVTRAARWDKPTLSNTQCTEGHNAPLPDPMVDMVTSTAASAVGPSTASRAMAPAPESAQPPTVIGGAADAAEVAMASTTVSAAAAPITHSPQILPASSDREAVGCESPGDSVAALRPLAQPLESEADDESESIEESNAKFTRLRQNLQAARSSSRRDLLRRKSSYKGQVRRSSLKHWQKARIGVVAMGRFARIAADQREREAAQALQATWRIAIARIVMNRRRRAQRHRTRVVNEMLQTERSYKRSIGIIAEHFIEPLRGALKKSRGILTAPQIQCVFGSLEPLHKLSCQFYEALETDLEGWNASTCIGGTVSRFAPFMRLYGAYCRDFDQSRRLLLELGGKATDDHNPALSPKGSTISAWRKFYNITMQQHADEFRGLDLSSYLIMPVQRVPRYVLLLRELLKHTWMEHPDRDDIYRSLQLMEGVAKDINAAIRKIPGAGQQMPSGDNTHAQGTLSSARNNSAALRRFEFEDGDMYSAQTAFGLYVEILGPGRQLVHHQTMPLATAFRGLDQSATENLPQLERESSTRPPSSVLHAQEERAELLQRPHLFLFNDLLVLAEVDDSPFHKSPSLMQRVRTASTAAPPPPPPDRENMSAETLLRLCSYSGHITLDETVHLYVLETPPLLPNCFRLLSEKQRAVITVQSESPQEQSTWIETLQELFEEQGRVIKRRAIAKRELQPSTGGASVPLIEVTRVEKGRQDKLRSYTIRSSKREGESLAVECRHSYRDIEAFDHRLRAKLSSKVQDQLPTLPVNQKRKSETVSDMQGVNISHFLQCLLMFDEVRRHPVTAEFFGLSRRLAGTSEV